MKSGRKCPREQLPPVKTRKEPFFALTCTIVIPGGLSPVGTYAETGGDGCFALPDSETEPSALRAPVLTAKSRPDYSSTL